MTATYCGIVTYKGKIWVDAGSGRNRVLHRISHREAGAIPRFRKVFVAFYPATLMGSRALRTTMSRLIWS
jgi:hypothetical protein